VRIPVEECSKVGQGVSHPFARKKANGWGTESGEPR